MNYLVIENTPGYMPESEADFTEYADAVAHANELANELEEQGYECDRSWASRDNYYAIMCRETEGTARLGRVIEVIKGRVMTEAQNNPALAALRHHVTGAIERGEKEGITEMTEAQNIEDNSQVVSVWSTYGHRFMSDGEPPYESCLTCGAMYQLLADADDPTRGEYLAADGSTPRECTHDTSMTHGYDPNCNCIACR